MPKVKKRPKDQMEIISENTKKINTRSQKDQMEISENTKKRPDPKWKNLISQMNAQNTKLLPWFQIWQHWAQQNPSSFLIIAEEGFLSWEGACVHVPPARSSRCCAASTVLFGILGPKITKWSTLMYWNCMCMIIHYRKHVHKFAKMRNKE